MALVKNDFPILEYDTDSSAVIMPNMKKRYNLPRKCVLVFFGDYAEEYAKTHKSEKIGEFDTATRLFAIYQTTFNEQELCFVHAPVGAAAAVALLDFVISHGVRHIVAAGCCGALHDYPENEILVPTSALRAEGASYHYDRRPLCVAEDREQIYVLRKAQ
jgi:uridine phosphorylase